MSKKITWFAVNFFQLLLLHTGPQLTPAASEAIRSFWSSVARRLETLAERVENSSPVTENAAVDELLAPSSALDTLAKTLTGESPEAMPNWELLSAARAVHERIEQLNHRHSQLFELNVNAQ